MASNFKIGKYRIDTTSAVFGAVALFVLCVLPKVGDFFSGLITKAREFVKKKMGGQ